MRLVNAPNPGDPASHAERVLPRSNTARRRAASPSRTGNATPRMSAAVESRPVDRAQPAVRPPVRPFVRDAEWNPAQSFAALTAARIEGGRAAVVRPEARRDLMRAGLAAGLRPFDATLIIAMVQDRARRGEPLADSAADPRLTAVRLPTRRFPLATAASAAATLALAASMFALAITWLAGV